MADADGETETFYERRLDRAPEKPEYYKLPDSDKKLVSHLRSTMLGVRQKVSELRDEVDDKERDATRESALRKAAEDRLEKLVDMYGDPAVNEELRDRLPRARKADPRVAWQKELDEMDAKSSSSAETANGAKTESDLTDGHTKDPSKRSHSPSHSPRPHQYPPAAGYPPPQYGGGQYYPPPPGFYPPAPPAVIYMASPQGSGAAAPGGPYMMSAAPPSNLQPAPGANLQPANQAPSSGSHDASTGSDVTGRGASGSRSSGGDPQAIASAAAKEISVNREQNRQISLLLAELDAARDLNKKLQSKLASTQHELQSLKITQETREAAIQAESSAKIAAAVEEVYRAQKIRDEAMMGRLRTANEERDEALLKLRKMETAVNEYDFPEHDDSTSLNLRDLLTNLKDPESGIRIDQNGRQLVEMINQQKERKRQIRTEEMKAVLEERDSAVTKSHKLEAEVLRLQRQIRGRTPDTQQQATLQAKLLTTQQERDIALGKLRKNDEELQTLRVYYSLHKSLSQEANLRDQFNNRLESYQGQLKHRDSVMDQTQKESNRLVSQLQAVMMEKAMVEAELAKSHTKQRNVEDEKLKLEKVVALLRERVKEMAPPIGDQ